MAGLHELRGSLSLSEVAKCVSERYGVPVDSLLRGVWARSEARQVALYLCRQHTDATRRLIGEYSGGIGYTAASKKLGVG